jgi:hypothetical protein
MTAALLVLTTLSAAQQAPEPKLPNPFALKSEEVRAGNPLAQYVEQLRQEKTYTADEMWRSTYWQARGTTASYLGDVTEADRSWNTAYTPYSPRTVLVKSPLEGYRPVDAVEAIARAARSHRWVMVGEEHLKPQSRTILPGLLRALRKQGFRTLAVETFNSPEDLAEAERAGYASLKTGTYTHDPVFAAGIREAIRLGYRLVPYEATEQPKEVPPDDTEFRQNFRENLQAKNLKTRIFDKDPNAKVLVWAGRAHVLESSQPSQGKSVWTPMAYEFKRLTGVDPLSVYATTYLEQSERRFDNPVYKWATDRGLVKRPTVFFDPKGKPFGESFDMQVFFPRTTFVQGRPDWLLREMDRRLVPLPTKLVKNQGLQLAQAFGAGEPVTAVPVDQVLIRPGDPVPALALPNGRFWVRVIDVDGKESGREEIQVRR